MPYRVVCRHGYRDEVITPDLAAVIYSHVRAYPVDKARPSCSDPRPGELSATSTVVDSEPPALSEKEIAWSSAANAAEMSVSDSLSLLEAAYKHRILYIVGKQEMHIRKSRSVWRWLILQTFLFVRENSRGKIQNLKVPTDRLVEIGFVKDI